MKAINLQDLNENFFETISKEWMLITAGTKDHFNTMTANWGGIGFLWNKPIVTIFVRPERYTREFIDNNSYFTLCFLGEENKKIHVVCGSKSGRNIDKVKETGLKTILTEKGNILFEQGRLCLECKKLYVDKLKPENFIDPNCITTWYDEKHGGYHCVYVAEITGVWLKE